MTALEGTAKTYLGEVMDEIDEEITQALKDLVKVEKLADLITTIQDRARDDVIRIISQDFSDDMNSVQKLIVGEKASRAVAAVAKDVLGDLAEEVVEASFNALDNLRNEIIGEVFETIEESE